MRCEMLQALGKCGDTSLAAVGDALSSAPTESATLLVVAAAGVVAVGYTVSRTSAGDRR